VRSNIIYDSFPFSLFTEHTEIRWPKSTLHKYEHNGQRNLCHITHKIRMYWPNNKCRMKMASNQKRI